MTYIAHFRHALLLVLFTAALACNNEGRYSTSDGAGPSVGKSVGGDSAINVEKSHPVRNVRGEDHNELPQDTLR